MRAAHKYGTELGRRAARALGRREDGRGAKVVRACACGSVGAPQPTNATALDHAAASRSDIKSGEIHARRIRAEMSRRQTRFQAMQQRLPDAAWELEHGGRKRHSAAEEGGMTSQSAIVDGEAAPTDAAPSERGDSSTKPSPAAGEDVGRLGLLAPDKEDRRIDDERLAFEEEEWRSGGGGPRGSDAQVTPSVSGFVGPSPFDRLLPGEIRRVAKVQRALCGRCHGFLCDGDVRDALPPPWCQVRVDALGLIQAVGPVGTAGAEVGEGGGDGHISLAEARASAEGGGEEDCVPFRAAIPGQQTCLFMDEATHELRREPPAGTSAAGASPSIPHPQWDCWPSLAIPPSSRLRRLVLHRGRAGPVPVPPRQTAQGPRVAANDHRGGGPWLHVGRRSLARR